MKSFRRDDGRALEVVKGFREQVLSYRRAVTPRRDWTGDDYTAAAEKKRRRFGRLLARFSEWGGQLEGARVLDVGCGDAINCLLLGLEPVREAVGIDLRLPLFSPEETGERTRALARKLVRGENFSKDTRLEPPSRSDNFMLHMQHKIVRPLAGEQPRQLVTQPKPTIECHQPVTPEAGDSIQVIREVMAGMPVRLAQMDATRLAFPDASFDWLISRSAMEHIRPVEQALREMARVVRPGGLIYLSIDPFFWVRGCHKRGVVDIPFAHARLTLPEFRRFVRESKGDGAAVRRGRRLETLNRFTLSRWQELIAAQPWDILDWNEEHSRIGEQVLEQYPDTLETLLPCVKKRDILHERIRVWLRKR